MYSPSDMLWEHPNDLINTDFPFDGTLSSSVGWAGLFPTEQVPRDSTSLHNESSVIRYTFREKKAEQERINGRAIPDGTRRDTGIIQLCTKKQESEQTTRV